MRTPVRIVIIAAAEVTGLPVQALAHGRRSNRRLVRYRWCTQAASVACGNTLAATARGFGRRGIPRGPVLRAALECADVVQRIEARAREIAERQSQGPAPSPSPLPCAATTVVAAAQVLDVSPRQLLTEERRLPWSRYADIAVTCAWRLGVPREDIAAVWRRTPGAITGRPGRHERIAGRNPDAVAAIIARATELARTCTSSDIANLMRGSADAIYTGRSPCPALTT